MEYAKPGSCTAPLLSLQKELTNRHQFLKILKQLQSDTTKSTTIVHTIIKKFENDMTSIQNLFDQTEPPLKTQVYVCHFLFYFCFFCLYVCGNTNILSIF